MASTLPLCLLRLCLKGSINHSGPVLSFVQVRISTVAALYCSKVETLALGGTASRFAIFPTAHFFFTYEPDVGLVNIRHNY